MHCSALSRRITMLALVQDLPEPGASCAQGNGQKDSRPPEHMLAGRFSRHTKIDYVHLLDAERTGCQSLTVH